jgi:oxalate decarboxylase family bicupin protein
MEKWKAKYPFHFPTPSTATRYLQNSLRYTNTPTGTKDRALHNMRLTRGSFRELHWHTADEWAIMLYGNTRVTVLNPDGTMFIDDVTKGDLWYFPAGFPHSIQGLGPDDGCEFLLVFDEGMFSEDDTFLISAWVAHTPPEILTKNSNLDRSAIARLPKDELYIFPANLPGSLAQAKAAVGGKNVESSIQYTFKMSAMAPTVKQPEAKSASSTPTISRPRRASPPHWSRSSQELSASCTGIQTPLSGSFTLRARGE